MKSPFVFAALWILALQLSWGNPFAVRYRVGLGDMSKEGDLLLSVPIGKIPLVGNEFVELRAEHGILAHAYGRSHSQISLTPLITYLKADAHGKWEWRQPCGEQVWLDIAESSGDAANERIALAPNGLVSSGFEGQVVYEANGTVCVFDRDMRVGVVKSDDWWLLYDEGMLRRFASPRGGVFDVECNGPRIRRILLAGISIFELVPTEEGVVARFRRKSVSINLDRWKSIERVTTDRGEEVAAFEYDERHLLKSFEVAGTREDVSWMPLRMDGNANPWSLPVHLSSVGDIRYEYAMDADQLLLTQRPKDGMERRMKIELHYSKVVSVKVVE